jgi:acetyl/propionyl-CoA carboxylase alpha subunit
MFKKLLIANRGEVAARVARTAKRLGMETVAVYSEADADGVHCHACDEAVLIGSTSSAGSPAAALPPHHADPKNPYLDVAALLSAADRTGADAIHPGYGMLSESVEFARAVVAAGISFVGPSPDVMAKVLDRSQARAIAIAAGVRVPEGSDAPLEDLAEAARVAEELGYPLMIKPVRVGAHINPVRVLEPDDLESAWARAREQAAGFGDARLILERAIDRPRHVDVQIVADEQGEVAAVWDRECSIQRAGYRLLYEAPAPALMGTEQGERCREAVFDAAARITKEAGYTNVGAVEFLIDSRGEPYFLEIRPRLAVAHATTEMCANVDLVEAQLVIAAGKPIPPDIQHSIPSGHALEVRLTTEQPNRGFAPSTGVVQELRWPNASPGRLRIEASVQVGSKVTADYDALVAKVITHAPTRHAAYLLLDRVLAESAVVPLSTNASFLRKILAHESFRAGQYDITFVDQLLNKSDRPSAPGK